MKKKIIVFGATGKVGTYVVDYLKRNMKNYQIISTGKRNVDCSQILGTPYYSVDITDKENFNSLPFDDIYAVVSLAAQLPTKSDGQNGLKQIQVNTIGTLNILEYCVKAKVDRFLYTQTLFDLGAYIKEGVILKAKMSPKFDYDDSHTLYVIAKNAAIELIKHYHIKYSLKYFIFRLPTIYAYNAWPYMYVDGVLRKRPLYIMIDKASEGAPLEIWGDPTYSKDMVHVYDFSQMVEKCLRINRDNGFYNVGTGRPVKLEEQVRTIAEVFAPASGASTVTYAPDKESSGGVKMDISEAIDELGYEPKYDCRKLFEDFKVERTLNRFITLRADPYCH